jgi:hypothetical protein
VTPSTEASPTITLADTILTSSADSGNTWYYDDTATTSTGQLDTARKTGVYYTIVTDPTTGCVLQSNSEVFKSSSNAIGLSVWPNPTSGSFNLSFYMTTQANTSIEIYDVYGNRVYVQQLSDFVGAYNSTIDAVNLASGMYVMKITHGGSTYHTSIIVRKL